LYGEAFAAISRSALINNLQLLQRKAEGARVIAVVKANAYGHGLETVVKTLLNAGVDFFAVARLSEALAIRQYCQKADILILGSTPPPFAALLSKNRLIQSVHSAVYARELSDAASEPIRMHLKIDCGMGRFGISLYRSGSIEDSLFCLSQPNLIPEAIFSHLPSADLPQCKETEQQRAAFDRFTDRLFEAYRPLPRHLLASAGILRYGSGGDRFIRPGLSLYGYPPAWELMREGFLPVLQLYAPVLAIRQLSKGDRLGYGGAFVAPHEMRVALLGIGYGDGLPRALSGATVLLGGRPAQIVGRICMDLSFCCIPDGLDLRVGDLALLFGDRAETLLSLSAHAATIPYELLTSLASRLCRQNIP
jgi:alanine racemase